MANLWELSAERLPKALDYRLCFGYSATYISFQRQTVHIQRKPTSAFGLFDHVSLSTFQINYEDMNEGISKVLRQ